MDYLESNSCNIDVNRYVIYQTRLGILPRFVGISIITPLRRATKVVCEVLLLPPILTLVLKREGNLLDSVLSLLSIFAKNGQFNVFSNLDTLMKLFNLNRKNITSSSNLCVCLFFNVFLANIFSFLQPISSTLNFLAFNIFVSLLYYLYLCVIMFLNLPYLAFLWRYLKCKLFLFLFLLHLLIPSFTYFIVSYHTYNIQVLILLITII